MASYNRVVLVGNLTRDPEIRTFPSGAIVADIGVAVNERRKDQSGNWVEEANFFDVTVWNRNAEVLRDYTSKGSPILVEGRLKQETWEQEGQKRSKVKISADRIVLLGGRSDGGNGGGYQQNAGSFRPQQPQRTAPPAQNYGDGGFSQEGGEDIPF